MDEVKKIVSDIKKGAFKPIYFLMGEEPYYIDKITEFIESNVLSEEEKGFNQMVLYGKDVSVEDIVANAKRYPMMAERQVVIVKEAQHLTRTIDKLESYASNPQPTTVLVFCYKYKTLDKRKKVTKTLAKNGLVFESKKLPEYKVADWIRKVLAGSGYQIHPKAAEMLVEFLGNDLGRISNELEKLKLVVPKEQPITPEAVETNIGISKDFNNFELKSAISERDAQKAFRIINYFVQNPKDNPLVVTIGTLANFFIQLLNYHSLSDKSRENVAGVLRVNPFFVKEFANAARHYPMKKVSYAIDTLRDIDVRGKGVNNQSATQGDLLKEMLVKLMY
ncbi:DNA polymerase III subunit delta [Robertkochia solimangrovi]|uniref:DNA polymerase III subunit delta n=1 Tax=Robertkochia solimangrovi TaxID=2213046 RepID=UPI001180F797|nr:DNA polymerase III subunit delta [Robertkochia solimangrovi]TRZ45207.1 DNA polymerase III subunit delta [Robertkochia solimangrovi]